MAISTRTRPEFSDKFSNPFLLDTEPEKLNLDFGGSPLDLSVGSGSNNDDLLLGLGGGTIGLSLLSSLLRGGLGDDTLNAGEDEANPDLPSLPLSSLFSFGGPSSIFPGLQAGTGGLSAAELSALTQQIGIEGLTTPLTSGGFGEGVLGFGGGAAAGGELAAAGFTAAEVAALQAAGINTLAATSGGALAGASGAAGASLLGGGATTGGALAGASGAAGASLSGAAATTGAIPGLGLAGTGAAVIAAPLVISQAIQALRSGRKETKDKQAAERRQAKAPIQNIINSIIGDSANNPGASDLGRILRGELGGVGGDNEFGTFLTGRKFNVEDNVSSDVSREAERLNFLSDLGGFGNALAGFKSGDLSQADFIKAGQSSISNLFPKEVSAGRLGELKTEETARFQDIFQTSLADPNVNLDKVSQQFGPQTIESEKLLRQLERQQE